MDGKTTEGPGGGGGGGEGIWCEDGAGLGSSSGELKATAEELVWRRRKTKGRRERREGRGERGEERGERVGRGEGRCSPQGVGWA